MTPYWRRDWVSLLCIEMLRHNLTSNQRLCPGGLAWAVATAQRIVYMWKRRLSGSNLRVLESLVKFCLQFYFKIYFDIKVRHLIFDAPYNVLTSLRILRAQPKKVRDAIIFYVRKGAWYAHPECLILSLLARPIMSETKFAINQVLKLRDGRDPPTKDYPEVKPVCNITDHLDQLGRKRAGPLLHLQPLHFRDPWL